MRIIAVALVVGTLAALASAQTCNTASSCSSCASWGSGTTRRWCSNDYNSIARTGCCVVSFSRINCPSSYQYQYTLSTNSDTNCNFLPDRNPDFYMGYNAELSAGQIVYIVAIVLIYFINIGAVVSYCRRRNIEACGYVALAVFFGWWVWCCLIPAGRQAQLVVIQTAPQHMQPYGQQPYGQPGYPQGQPGYAPQQQGAYTANPYGQPPQNPYAQPPNPYAQAPNPYASGDIVKPQ